MSEPIVLTFDIGVKNLAYALVRGDRKVLARASLTVLKNKGVGREMSGSSVTISDMHNFVSGMNDGPDIQISSNIGNVIELGGEELL